MANGEVWPSQRNIHFSHGTSSSGLRNHLDKWHCALYLQLAKEHGWTIQLPSHRDAIARQAAAAQSVVQHTPFSPDGLLNRLVWFIVANDQVCMYLPDINLYLTNMQEYQCRGEPTIS